MRARLRSFSVPQTYDSTRVVFVILDDSINDSYLKEVCAISGGGVISFIIVGFGQIESLQLAGLFTAEFAQNGTSVSHDIERIFVISIL